MQFIPFPFFVLKEKAGREKMQHNIGEKKPAATLPKMNYPLNESHKIIGARVT